MTTDEKLDLLISDVSSIKTDVSSLQTDVSSLQTNVSSLQSEMKSVKSQLRPITNRLDSLDTQIKRTEKNLSTKIDVTERLVLDEVERVHDILDNRYAALKSQRL